MPKNKTHSGISKRVKVTGSGKIMHAGSAKRHHLERQALPGHPALGRYARAFRQRRAARQAHARHLS